MIGENAGNDTQYCGLLRQKGGIGCYQELLSTWLDGTWIFGQL